MSDQLIGQWWAHQLGLGYILPQEMVVSALRSIFKYNFKSDLTGWQHTPRAFAGAKDKGLIVCTWPKGGRPADVMLYSDEVWTGIEYQVASHMIYEGLLEEGLCIVKGARDRYDGMPRPADPAQSLERNRMRRPLRPRDVFLVAAPGAFGLSLRRPGGRAWLFATISSQTISNRSSARRKAGAALLKELEGNAQQVRIIVYRGILRVKTLRLATANNSKPARVAVFANGERRSADFQNK